MCRLGTRFLDASYTRFVFQSGFPVSIIPAMLHTCLHLTTTITRRTRGRSQVTKYALFDIRGDGQTSTFMVLRTKHIRALYQTQSSYRMANECMITRGNSKWYRPTLTYNPKTFLKRLFERYKTLGECSHIPCPYSYPGPLQGQAGLLTTSWCDLVRKQNCITYYASRTNLRLQCW